MNDSKVHPSPEQSRSKRFFANVKEHLLSTLLLAVTGPLTLCVFGPMNLFGNNMDEFSFVLGDFFWWNILTAFLASAVIALILLPMKGLLYDIFYTFFLGTTVALFLQGNYLNFGLHSLGKDDGVVFKGSTVAVNILIWLVIYAACTAVVFLLRKKHREILSTVTTILLITVIGMQLVSTVALSLTTDVWKSHDALAEEHTDSNKNVLTYNNLNQLSKDGNIVYFIVDRFDWRYCDQALREMPGLFEDLDGFTLYDDAMSIYPRTFPSVAYMLTGVKNDWSMSRPDYLDYAYSHADFLKLLKASNYNVNLYTDPFYGYNNASSMKDYVTNSTPLADYRVINSAGLSMKMSGLALYRFFPFFAKNWVTVSTVDFAGQTEDINSDAVQYTTDMRDLYNQITKESFTTFEGSKNFAFVHFSGMHTPFIYDDEFNPMPSGQEAELMSAMRQSFKIIYAYINEMKRLGVYENSTIIITGDHCSITSDTKAPFHAHSVPIFFKAKGQSGTPMVRNSAPVTHDNVMASILKSEGLDYSQYGRPLDEVTPENTPERLYYFQRHATTAENGQFIYEEIIYKVTGSARNFDNWQEISRKTLGKSVYD